MRNRLDPLGYIEPRERTLGRPCTRDLGLARSRLVRVLPRPRGSWIVVIGQDQIVSEHGSASQAELAGMACLREGDELVVYDRYHRCHRRSRPAPPPRADPEARVLPAVSEPEAALPPRVESPRKRTIEHLLSRGSGGRLFII